MLTAWNAIYYRKYHSGMLNIKMLPCCLSCQRSFETENETDTCRDMHIQTEHDSVSDAKVTHRMSEITRPGSIPFRFLWDLWCTKWHWDHVFLWVLLFFDFQYYSANAPHSYFTHLRTLLYKLLQLWCLYIKIEGWVCQRVRIEMQ